MMKGIILIMTMFLFFFKNSLAYDEPVAQEVLQKVNRQFFIENKGQWDDEVLFLTRMGGLDVWITKYGVAYNFYKIEHKHPEENKISKSKFDEASHEDCMIYGHNVIFKLKNHNAQPLPLGRQKQEGYYNYLIGNDLSKHVRSVRLYKEVLIKDVYQGIDIRYYFDEGYLRYDFIVHPGADPKQIQFTLDGDNEEYLKENSVYFTTRFGEVVMQDLTVYQEGTIIKSRFNKTGEIWRIELGDYDKSKVLVIDPLVYSTYLGGSSTDISYAIDVDASGNAYVTGSSVSANYDITPGAFQTTWLAKTDAFVTKLNPAGSALVYSTYIAGNEHETGYGIAVDNMGIAYITGATNSSNYITTTGAYQTVIGGLPFFDAFVTKLDATGAFVLYSTFIGGSGDDIGRDIAADNFENVYITGETNSPDYDVTTGAFQTTGSSYDAFVTKLNTSIPGLTYSTYISGHEVDKAYGITIDASGNAYITGKTNSLDFPVTVGAYKTVFGGGIAEGDVFVTKLNATGSALVYSTYLGELFDDIGRDIAIDASGNAYITGQTRSSGFPVTSGSYQTTIGGNHDIFVTKLNPVGSALVYSTFIGGSADDIAYGVAVDAVGNAYITGETRSTNYDIIPFNAYQLNHDGGISDVVISKLNPAGSALLYSSYIGGSADDIAYGIAIDALGNAYITGKTNSTNYDITTGAYQTVYDGGVMDAFVTKICLPPIVIATTTDTIICQGDQVTLTGVGTATAYTWDNGVTDGVPFTPTTTTTYTVTGSDASSCLDTAQITIIVNPLPTVTANASLATICLGDSSILTVSGASTYTWDNGLGAGQTHTVSPTSTTIYTVTGTDANGCTNTDQVTLTVNPLPTVTASATPSTICFGDNTTLTASGATTYTWDNGLGAGQTHTITPASITTYMLTGTDANGCTNTDQVTVTVNPLPLVTANATDTVVCQGAQVTLTGAGAVTYSWDNGVFDGVPFNPPLGTTTYTVTGTDANGCTDTDDIDIYAEEVQVAFTVDVEPCEPYNAVFTNNSSTNGTFNNCYWELSNGDSFYGCGTVPYTFDAAGNYDVTLTVTTLNGCSDTQTYTDYVSLQPMPIASFEPTNITLTTLDSEVEFNNISQNANSYWWNFGDGNTSTMTNPTHIFPNEEGGSYEVMLVANSALGCSDTIVSNVTVEELLIFYVPNSFTPDGDEFNQTFRPVFTTGYDPYDFVMYIYNRWGELIFETHNDKIGWDGTYDGKYAPDGTYIWKIEVKTTMSDERKMFTGSVNILR